jgi:hypothetical protein
LEALALVLRRIVFTSSLRDFLKLCRSVLRASMAAWPSTVSSSSLTNSLVVDVSGSLGVMDGFRLMVPMGKSESKAFSKVGVAVPLLERSDKHPLEEELDARLFRLSCLESGREV